MNCVSTAERRPVAAEILFDIDRTDKERSSCAKRNRPFEREKRTREGPFFWRGTGVKWPNPSPLPVKLLRHFVVFSIAWSLVLPSALAAIGSASHAQQQKDEETSASLAGLADRWITRSVGSLSVEVPASWEAPPAGGLNINAKMFPGYASLTLRPLKDPFKIDEWKGAVLVISVQDTAEAFDAQEVRQTYGEVNAWPNAQPSIAFLSRRNYRESTTSLLGDPALRMEFEAEMMAIEDTQPYTARRIVSRGSGRMISVGIAVPSAIEARADEILNHVLGTLSVRKNSSAAKSSARSSTSKASSSAKSRPSGRSSSSSLGRPHRTRKNERVQQEWWEKVKLPSFGN